MKIQQYCKRKLDEATLQVNRLLEDGKLRPLQDPPHHQPQHLLIILMVSIAFQPKAPISLPPPLKNYPNLKSHKYSKVLQPL